MLLAISSMWGLSFLLVELALRELAPLWIVLARTLVGGVVLLVLLHLRGRRLPTEPRLWGHLVVLGLVNTAAPWTAVVWAQQTLPSSLAALLMALGPTSTLLVAAMAGIERITVRRLVGLLLALAGVGAIVAADLEQPGRIAAVLAVALGTVFYAVGAVYAKRYVSGSVPALVLATGQVVTASAFLLPVSFLLESEVPELGALSATTLLAVGLLGAFGTGFAFFLFFVLIARVGATNASLTSYLIPLVGVAAGVSFLGERLAPGAVLGGALIVLGIWLAQRGERPARGPA